MCATKNLIVFVADSPRCLEWWSLAAVVSRALRDRRSHPRHVGKTRRRRLITCCRLWPTARHFWPWPPNIAHSAWMHGTLWNAIFASLIASEIDVIDTLRFNNDVDYIYRLATVLEMRLNHEYWCEPECTWQTNSINKTATSWQLGFQTLERYWASFQVTRLSQCNQFFQPGRLLEWRVFHFFIFLFFWGWWWWGGGVGGGGVVGTQLQCIYYLELYTDLKAAEGN